MAVTIFNPSASAIDGTTTHEASAPGASIATLRAGAGNTTPDLTILVTALFAGQSGAGYSNFRYFTRPIILFDTSILGSGAVISAATFELYMTEVSNDSWGDGAVALVSSTPASDTTLANEDYAQVGSTRFATDLTIAGLTNNAYNTWTLNAAGIANINKTGISKFALRMAYDFDNVDPGWTNNYLSRFIAHSQQGANKPKLTVTYTVGAGGFFLLSS